jgi:hypothetical protein
VFQSVDRSFSFSVDYITVGSQLSGPAGSEDNQLSASGCCSERTLFAEYRFRKAAFT